MAACHCRAAGPGAAADVCDRPSVAGGVGSGTICGRVDRDGTFRKEVRLPFWRADDAARSAIFRSDRGSSCVRIHLVILGRIICLGRASHASLVAVPNLFRHCRRGRK